MILTWQTNNRISKRGDITTNVELLESLDVPPLPPVLLVLVLVLGTRMAATRKPQKRSMASHGSYLVGLLVAFVCAAHSIHNGCVIYEWQQLAISSI
ncbi:unnamed protein product [Ceratitis capitata]|uniref:(Mediterranean fruit fly) hypothetical protein n=1 Tax=Ceratitis capitata TaxID=7213 RepID=A0A811UW90_CERCA|nr:unnamed protein product [Ceratitis capitata]